jgi:hypothetical protein
MGLLADQLMDLLVDLLAGLLVAWWGQEARPRWGNHAPPAGRRMCLPLKEARSRAPRAPSWPARSFREMCPSWDNTPERAPPISMVSASSLTQTQIASCGRTSRFKPWSYIVARLVRGCRMRLAHDEAVVLARLAGPTQIGRAGAQRAAGDAVPFEMQLAARRVSQPVSKR